MASFRSGEGKSELTRAQLQQLVGEIADEIVGSTSRSPRGRQVAESHAERELAEFAPKDIGLSETSIPGLIDHTNLKPDATCGDISRLCEEAAGFGFATVCVHSIWVPLAHSILRGSAVKVCTVTGFPTGAVPTAAKCMEAEIAVRNGAAEVDMVIPIGLLRQGELDMVKQDMAAVVQVARAGGAILKVILETAVLSEREIAVGCALARLAGAHFVKTSTGFHPAGGATEATVHLLRHAVGGEMGVKASGGIRTLQDLRTMVAAGANRIGTSSGVAIMAGIAS